MLGIFIIIFIVSLIFILTAKVYNDNNIKTDYMYRSSCLTDDECENIGCNGNDKTCKGSKCVYDPDYLKNVCIPPGMNICKISDTDVVQGQNYSIKWKELGLTLCKEDSECDQCINQPQWGCFTDWPKTSRDPLVKTKASNNKCSIDGVTPDEDGFCNIFPPGDENGKLDGFGYCMPKIENADGPDSSCNPATSDIYLTQHDKYSSNWSCMCKNPAMFDHITTSTSDCTFQKTCGYNPDPSLSKGSLYMQPDTDDPKPCNSESDCGSDQKCCVSDSSMQGSVCLSESEALDENETIQYVCHDKWNDKNTSNWVTQGKCACEPGFTYVNIIPTEDTDLYSSEKLCLRDACYDETLDGDFKGKTLPYTDVTNKGCKCPSERPVRCPQDIENPTTAFATFNNSVCQTIPSCLSDPCGSNGTFTDGSCHCKTGFTTYDMQWSISGNTCEDPCKNNGPCGERGTCKVEEIGGQKIVGCNCFCPHTNPCNQYLDEPACEIGTHLGSRTEGVTCRWDDSLAAPFKCVLIDTELTNSAGLRNECQETIPGMIKGGFACYEDTKCCGAADTPDYDGTCKTVETNWAGVSLRDECVS